MISQSLEPRSTASGSPHFPHGAGLYRHSEREHNDTKVTARVHTFDSESLTALFCPCFPCGKAVDFLSALAVLLSVVNPHWVLFLCAAVRFVGRFYSPAFDRWQVAGI